ncbi:MAG: DUF4296 domain-containing protein [Candidatus Azobacteroides sp.]|nr:DUF4296 domain-containing protein [Candidatus Azobacteroides sp.]
MNKPVYILFLVILFSVVSCRKTPPWVIPQENMEEILVDVHIADVLIQEDYRTFNTVEKKEALYRAVLDKHGITKQELDTSLYWYGRNSELYIKMYEKVNKKLLDREKLISQSSPYSLALQSGDTVNIWNDKSYLTFTSSFPYNNYLYKEIVTDTAFYTNDIYELSMRISGLSAPDSSSIEPSSKVVMVFKYPNDSLFVEEKKISGNGPFVFRMETDSLIPEKIYSNLWFNIEKPDEKVFVDSISFWRIHKKKLPETDPIPDILQEE